MVNISRVQADKTHRETLNEVVARSKEKKLEKARSKEEQETERERLDEDMGELLGLLNWKPPKPAERTARESLDDYDQAMRVSTARQLLSRHAGERKVTYTWSMCSNATAAGHYMKCKSDRFVRTKNCASAATSNALRIEAFLCERMEVPGVRS